MRHLWPMAAVLFVLCTLAAAHAAPSFVGDTGLILTPNARTADRHTALPHWHSMSGTMGEEEGNASGNWDAAGALVGLTDRLELYLGYFSYDDRPFDSYSGFDPQDQFVAHVKGQALREPDDCIDLAIGIRNMGMDDRDGDHEPTGYIVATKTLCGSDEEDKYLRLSLGVQMGNEDDFFAEEYWPEPPQDDQFLEESLFGSAEWRLNRHVALMAEMQEVGSSVLNFGARLNPCDSVAVDAFFIEDKVADDYDMAVGISGLIPFDSDTIGSPDYWKESHYSTAPSHFGDTGLILIPTALTAPRHTVTPTYHLVSDAIGDEEENDIGEWENVGALVGTTDRLEVYGGQLSFEDDPFDDPGDRKPEEHFVVHAKAQALREPDNCCNVAVGIRNLFLDQTDESGDNEATAYVVATKTLASSEENNSFFRATAGVFLANEDSLLNEEYWADDPDTGDEYEGCSLFGGAEWRPCRWLTLMGEVIESGPDDAVVNWGVRVHPIDALVLDGYLVEDTQQSEHKFGFGASYQIDF